MNLLINHSGVKVWWCRTCWIKSSSFNSAALFLYFLTFESMRSSLAVDRLAESMCIACRRSACVSKTRYLTYHCYYYHRSAQNTRQACLTSTRLNIHYMSHKMLYSMLCSISLYACYQCSVVMLYNTNIISHCKVLKYIPAAPPC